MLGLVAQSARYYPAYLRSPCASSLLKRTYAFSRFPEPRPVGAGRKRPGSRPVQPNATKSESQHENVSSEDESRLWQSSIRPASSDPKETLRRILMENETLVIERELEMLNIFIGFEQCNKYAINNLNGDPVGYITEEPGSFLASFGRQLLGTHRPFRALIMDLEGTPLLWLRRPFAWINSRMYVQRRKDLGEYSPDGEPVLDTFAEVQQVWHIIRRRYDLFIRNSSQRILSLASDPQPTPEPSTFSQFAHVDSGFLAWDFKLQDARGEQIAFITRSFRGFGRELFTDTGMYAIHFGPPPQPEMELPERSPTIIRRLTLDERALALALAVNIDFDYFSRHSGTGMGGGFMHLGGD